MLGLCPDRIISKNPVGVFYLGKWRGPSVVEGRARVNILNEFLFQSSQELENKLF